MRFTKSKNDYRFVNDAALKSRYYGGVMVSMHVTTTGADSNLIRTCRSLTV